MEQKTKKSLGFLLMTIAAAIVIYTFLVLWSGAHEIAEALGRISSVQFLYILGASLAGFLIRFGRWYGYLHHLDHRLPVFPALRFYTSGMLFTLTPARSGQAIRSVYLRKYDVPYANSLWIMFLEQVNDVTGMLILSTLVMSLFTHSALFLLIISVLAVLLALLATQIVTILKFLSRRRFIGVFPRVLNFITRIEQTAEGATRLFTVKLQLAGLVATVAGFALQGFGFYLVINYLGLNVTPWTAIGIFALSMSIGSFSFLPGGLGSTEAIMLGLLTLSGAAMPDAVAITIIGRTTNLWFGVFLGVLATVSLGLAHRKDAQQLFTL